MMKNIPLYIAKRYFFSRTNTNAVNIITSIAVIAILVSTAALFIILSVFSGLEKMNIKFYSNVNPDLKISAARGKLLKNVDEVVLKINTIPQILSSTKVIEEKIYLSYEDKQDIAYLKAIGKDYTDVVRLDTTMITGDYLSFSTPNEIIVSDGIARRLQLFIDYENPATLLMPKPGEGLITREEQAINKEIAYSKGIFFLNEHYDQFLFAPLSLAYKLLDLDENAAYSLELKTKPDASLKEVKKKLQKELGNEYVVETRQDLDSAFQKVMNIENLIIYLIFTLVIIIASFNLAGTVIVIILDKKEEIKTMISFGMTSASIKTIFFYTGIIITCFALIFGLIIATIIGLLQQKYSLVMASIYTPFPIIFTVQNYLIVIGTVAGIGGLVSYLTSRKITE